MVKVRLKKQTKTLDRKLLLITLLLTGLGLVAVADASAPIALRNFGDRFYFVKQQAVWAVIGVFCLFIFSKIKYTLWERLATPLFFGSIALLVLVLIPGLGIKVLGARRWFSIGPVTFQPSEFVKLFLVIYLAKVASKGMPPLSYFVPPFLMAGLIMLQPDLGTTIVLVGTAMAQIFVSGVSLFHLSAALFFSVLVSTILVFMSGYRRDRLLTFLKQTHDPLGKAYHISQILIGLGAGGFWGVGLGQSRQKYLFLPETATDSIFAVVAEEIGFLGAGVLIIIFSAFILKGMLIARNAPDKFSRVLAVGVVGWIGIQILLNLASMVAVVPLTGIPLPFFSYGGSSLTAALIGTGILLNISKYVEKAK